MLSAAEVLVVLTVAIPAQNRCPFTLGIAPIIEVSAQQGRAPLSLFPIGFSKGGHLAWIERRQGFDDDTYEWSLHIEDLSRDRQITERSFSMRPASLEAFCAKHGPTILRVLERQGVEIGSAPRLEQPASTG